ncbi:amino acid permease [Streptomyces violaceorubidus]
MARFRMGEGVLRRKPIEHIEDNGRAAWRAGGGS